MTDTPDAPNTLIARYYDAVRAQARFPSSMAESDQEEARRNLCARLTAGDAAIKRVAAIAKEQHALWDAIEQFDPATQEREPGCRDCADLSEAGLCPHDKWPCDPAERAVAKVKEIHADLAAARANIERKDAALKLAAENLAREYESEYAGRTEVYCTACNARLTDGDKHHEGCEWAAIDAALAPKETNNG